ncbi:MAG TPA: nuclear transport factor 2 family protein [Mycobacterium sp.]|nr:nuclear transport factor 2 family protein [Mycobacterium sp.]
MTTSEIATVLAWHDALNARDGDTLVEISTGDIEIGDADGAVQGHDALREWAGSVESTVEPGRMFVHDGVVVVEQRVGDQSVASAFRVVHDKVASVYRHPDLAAALAATELTEDDFVDG